MCAPQLGDRVREALMDRSGSAEEQAVRYVTAALEAADGKQKTVRSLMMSMTRHGWMGLNEDFFNAYFHVAPSARKYVKLVSLRDTENGPRTLAVQTLDLPQGPLPFSLMHDLCKTYPAIRTQVHMMNAEEADAEEVEKAVRSLVASWRVLPDRFCQILPGRFPINRCDDVGGKVAKSRRRLNAEEKVAKRLNQERRQVSNVFFPQPAARRQRRSVLAATPAQDHVEAIANFARDTAQAQEVGEAQAQEVGEALEIVAAQARQEGDATAEEHTQLLAAHTSPWKGKQLVCSIWQKLKIIKFNLDLPREAFLLIHEFIALRSCCQQCLCSRFVSTFSFSSRVLPEVCCSALPGST